MCSSSVHSFLKENAAGFARSGQIKVSCILSSIFSLVSENSPKKKKKKKWKEKKKKTKIKRKKMEEIRSIFLILKIN